MVLRDLIATMSNPGYSAWVSQVWGVGGCAHPIHLRGMRRVVDAAGTVTWERSGGEHVMMRCGNRRAAVCPSCSRLYEADTFQLIRAGLAGGKGVPESVSGHPAVFVTLTAPSFGAVHGHRVSAEGEARACMARSGRCEHGRSRGCFRSHAAGDLVVGTPICAECYDYPGAVVWQASVGDLWSRLRTYLPRHLGRLGGRSRREVQGTVRLSYTRITEMQRRGLLHVHAVVRADGVSESAEGDGGPGPVVAPAEWVSAELLERAVRSAVAAVMVTVNGGPAGSWQLRWGRQLDVQVLEPREGPDGAARTAAYLSKYATKSLADWGPVAEDDSPHGAHVLRMIRTAWELGQRPELERLRLLAVGRELGVRARVSTRSRSYSSTLGALREARAEYRRQQMSEAQPHLSSVDWEVESFWEVAGFGHSPGEAVIAEGIAAEVRSRREIGRQEVADEEGRGQ